MLKLAEKEMGRVRGRHSPTPPVGIDAASLEGYCAWVAHFAELCATSTGGALTYKLYSLNRADPCFLLLLSRLKQYAKELNVVAPSKGTLARALEDVRLLRNGKFAPQAFLQARNVHWFFGDTMNAAKVDQFIEDLLGGRDVDRACLFAMTGVLHEAAANAIRHARAGDRPSGAFVAGELYRERRRGKGSGGQVPDQYRVRLSVMNWGSSLPEVLRALGESLSDVDGEPLVAPRDDWECTLRLLAEGRSVSPEGGPAGKGVALGLGTGQMAFLASRAGGALFLSSGLAIGAYDARQGSDGVKWRGGDRPREQLPMDGVMWLYDAPLSRPVELSESR